MHSKAALLTTLAIALCAGCQRDPSQIRIGNIGWVLVIDEDGGGHYGFGSGAITYVGFAKGTFSHRDVRRALEPRLERKRSAASRYYVTLGSEGGWTDDRQSLIGLFQAAHRAAPPPQPIQQLWDENPPP